MQGVILRLTDITTAIAFFYINLGMPGEENRFYFQYPDDADMVRYACLVFLGIGIALAPCDIWASYRRTIGTYIKVKPKKNRSDPLMTGEQNRLGRTSWTLTFTVLIMLLEDVSN